MLSKAVGMVGVCGVSASTAGLQRCLQKTLLRCALSHRLAVHRSRLGAEAVVVASRVVVGPVRGLGLLRQAHLLVEAVLAPAGLLAAPGGSRRAVASEPRLDAGAGGRRRLDRRSHGAGVVLCRQMYKMYGLYEWRASCNSGTGLWGCLRELFSRSFREGMRSFYNIYKKLLACP